MLNRIWSVVIAGLLTTTATASINIDLVEVDNSANPILNGFRTFDLIITTTSQWTTSAMFLELEQGSVYQDALGAGFNAPDPAQIGLGGLEFDTYYALPDVGQGNGATDVGGTQTFPADTVGIDRSWGTPQNQFDFAGLSSSGTQLAMRVTLSDDAVGTWSFGAIELGTPQAKFLNNPITADTMSIVPLQGDLNRDGFVGIEDLNYVLANWNQTVVDPWCLIWPCSGEFIGIEDLNIVLSNWNAGILPRPILATPNPWGDLNGDGFVGITDPKELSSRWGLEVTPGDGDDPSGDGFVGIDDLSIIMDTWNLGSPPPPAVIPEPAAIGVLGLGLAVMINRPRSRA